MTTWATLRATEQLTRPDPTGIDSRAGSWLPDIPGALRQDAEAIDYLDRLARRVEQLAERVTDEARQAGASDQLPWQRTLPSHVDDQLIGDLALWRAAHDIPSTDQSPTGPPIKEPQAARHQSRLIRRLAVPPPLSSTPTADAAPDRLRASQRQAERQRLHDGATRHLPGPSR